MTRTQFADARRNIRKQIIPWVSIVVIGMVALIAYLGLIYASVAINKDVSAYLDRYGLWDLEISSTLMMDEEDLAVICHGGPIAAVMAYLFPEEEKNRYQWQPRNGEGYLICLREGERTWHNIPQGGEEHGG